MKKILKEDALIYKYKMRNKILNGINTYPYLKNRVYNRKIL